MRRDHTPLQVFTVASPARSPETKASPAPEAPNGRKPRYDRTLHLASERPPAMPRGAPVSPVLHAEIPGPLEPTRAAAPPGEPTPSEQPPVAPAIAPSTPAISHAPSALARRGGFLDAIDRFVARVAAWLSGLVAPRAR